MKRLISSRTRSSQHSSVIRDLKKIGGSTLGLERENLAVLNLSGLTTDGLRENFQASEMYGQSGTATGQVTVQKRGIADKFPHLSNLSNRYVSYHRRTF